MVQEEFDAWAAQVAQWPGIDAGLLPAIGQRMFGGEFLFSVTRDYVAACHVPMLLMPGNDRMHPAAISDTSPASAAREVIDPWKGPQHRDAAIDRALQFLLQHTKVSA